MEVFHLQQKTIRDLRILLNKHDAALREMINEARERNKAAGFTIFNPAALEVATEAVHEFEQYNDVRQRVQQALSVLGEIK